MQDMILLGFLMKGEKTGYQVKKLMESSTSFFFNTSLGSIYPAFRKLESKGLVNLEQQIDGGRVKNSYSITSEGRQVFLEWLQQGLEIRKVKEEALLKIFFFSELSESDRIRQISGYIQRLRDQVKALKNVTDKLSDIKPDPFMMKTLEFGTDYYTFLLEWQQRFLSVLENGPTVRREQTDSKETND